MYLKVSRSIRDVPILFDFLAFNLPGVAVWFALQDQKDFRYTLCPS